MLQDKNLPYPFIKNIDIHKMNICIILAVEAVVIIHVPQTVFFGKTIDKFNFIEKNLYLPEVTRLPSMASNRSTFVSELRNFALEPNQH